MHAEPGEHALSGFLAGTPLLYPDPITSLSSLSGAALLYFPGPLNVTLHSRVIIDGSYEILDLVNQRRPDWSSDFLLLFNVWRAAIEKWRTVVDAIQRMIPNGIKTVYMSYSANSQAMASSKELVEATGLTIEQAFRVIDIETASGELMRHILLEMFLELGEDIESLYEYCSSVFSGGRTEEQLVLSYLIRVKTLIQIAGMPHRILLTNQRLTTFLESLPVEAPASEAANVEDVATWELFRQILSPVLDPLDMPKLELVAELAENHGEEIGRFKLKCETLAQKTSTYDTMDDLIRNTERLIRLEADREIAELLKLDQRGLERFFTELFFDKQAWAGVLGFAFATSAGNPAISVGSAILGLASIGSKAFKVAAERRSQLRQSDYALVYRISRDPRVVGWEEIRT